MTFIVLISSRPIYRKALKALLEEDSGFTVIRETSAWPAAETLPPGHLWPVCVVEAGAGNTKLHSRPPLPAVFLLSGKEPPAFLHQIYERASTSCLMHTDGVEELHEAIRSAARGSRYTSASFRAFVQARGISPAAGKGPARRLSPREWEVLYYMALGYANKEIAAILIISVKTVEAHRTNLMEKLEMKTKKELVEYAFQSGLIHSKK